MNLAALGLFHNWKQSSLCFFILFEHQHLEENTIFGCIESAMDTKIQNLSNFDSYALLNNWKYVSSIFVTQVHFFITWLFFVII